MSLILEALRKSEAERRRGLTPDVFTELPPVAQRRVPALSTRHWLLLALCVLVLSAALAWLLREHWLPPPAPEATPVVEAGAAVSGAATASPDIAPPAGIATDDKDIAADRSPDTVQVSPTVTPAPAAPQPVEQRSVASQPEAATPDITPSGSEPARQQPPPAAAPVETPPPAVQPPVVAPVEPPATPAVAEAQTPAATPGSTRDDTLLELSDLTADQRRQLPPLKLSMHLWNKDPSRRFVIIDGTRLGEGDRIGDAVIDSITADSVVLDWNGRRLRLSLR